MTENIHEEIQDRVQVMESIPEAPFWTKLDGLPSMLKALAEARAAFELMRQRQDEAEVRMGKTPEYMAYLAACAAVAMERERAATLDATVRKLALDDFKANGEKAVYAGISIKLFSKYDYDPTQLRAWAIEQKVFALLTLDVRRTERAAAAGILENAPIVVSKEPRVQIATDLSGYLTKVQP